MNFAISESSRPVSPQQSRVRFGSAGSLAASPALRQQLKECAVLLPLNLLIAGGKAYTQCLAYKKEGFTGETAKTLNTIEVVRSYVNTGLWLSSRVATFFLSRPLFPQMSAIGRLLLSDALASVPDMTLRPWLTARITGWILRMRRIPETTLATPASLKQIIDSYHPATTVSGSARSAVAFGGTASGPGSQWPMANPRALAPIPRSVV